MEEIVFDCGWLKVKKTPRGYYYSERKGIDSIAILLYKIVTDDDYTFLKVLVRMQPLPIENSQTNDDKDVPKLFACPITGGIEEGEHPHITARREILEEAGYDIPLEALNYAGEYYVGTQTNEKVYMYMANVEAPGVEKNDIKNDGTYFESISENKWLHISDCVNAKYSGLNILANILNDCFENELLDEQQDNGV